MGSLTTTINLNRWWKRRIFKYTRHNKRIKDNKKYVLDQMDTQWKIKILQIKRRLSEGDIRRNEIAVKRG